MLCHLLYLASLLWLCSIKSKWISPAYWVCLAVALSPWKMPSNAGGAENPLGRQQLFFYLSEMRELRGSRGPIWFLQGRVRSAPTSKKLNPSLRVNVVVPANSLDTRPGSWRLEGQLSQRPFSTHWQLQSTSPWIPCPTYPSRATAYWLRWRFEKKKALSKWIAKSLPPTQARSMIVGLCTGRQQDARLSFVLSHAGLSHLLAVSGFHFVCVVGSFEFLLRGLGCQRRGWLLIPTIGYFVYMGPSASVFRAGVMSLSRCVALQVGKSYRPLQALGYSLMLWCLLWPDQTRDLGFQLSYLCTAALLLLAQPLRELLDFLWPENRLHLLLASRAGDRGRRIAERFRTGTRAALAANFSAHLAIFAPQLCNWHFFPISSLWFNLLIPPCIGALMQLLLLAVIAAPILPKISHVILELVHYLLQRLLAATQVSRPWECLLWAECSTDIAAHATALLLLIGLFWSARSYRPGPLDQWTC